MDALRRQPLLASVAFVVVGNLIVALSTPGLDLLAPTLGGLIVLVLAVASYVGLRRSSPSS